ncbi:Hypothetical protein NTJ_00765 [Nesidiocoris tenuis]|uniref:Uncharacterized protein n=1 Tax=Nesidiocoris tenuis TaxID=355587 RepID=A0ABN7A9Y3_9HEMI|nr:Hypothetical protein NTJ_00765 [Nesidiocoris tenuis]
MIWVPFFACSLAFAWGHDAHRGGGRVRFPFDGPPPPPPIDMMQLFSNPPRIFGAESQGHPIFQESPPPFNHHVPFSLLQQIPKRGAPFGDGSPYRGGDVGFAESSISNHQSAIAHPNGQHANRRPTRTKEGLHQFYHETQPPPFVTPPTLMAAASGGSQRIKISGHPSSLHSSNADDSQRHRFGPNRHSGHNERRPSGHRSPPPPPPGHEHFQPTPSSSYEYEPSQNSYEPHRYTNDGPRPSYQGDSRPRPQPQEKPNKVAGYSPNRERFPPGPSEKPFVYKEKAKTPFNGIKKPLFSPTVNQEKAVYKQQPPPSQGFRSQPQNDYPRPTPTEQDSDYYQAKLKDEYYSGLKQNVQQSDYPSSPSRRYPASTHPQAPNTQPGPTKPSNHGDGNFAFNEPFQFDTQYFAGQNEDPGSVSSGNPNFPPIPQSEEFADFFEGGMPDWMNDFKSPSENEKNSKGSQATNGQRLHSQETQRQPYQQGQQSVNYFDEEYNNAADHNKYVKKRNPNKQQSGEYHGNEEKRYYPKTQVVQKPEKRPLPDSYYDVPDSSEFDFGSSSEFNMHDFNIGSFKYGEEQKPAGSEWIPINAPSGAVPAKSYDIPPPDLSQEQYPSQHHQQPLRRQLSDESLSDLAEKSSAVVYGARERKRQNEGVVSASVMVKQ